MINFSTINVFNLIFLYSQALDHAYHKWFPALSHLQHLEVAVGAIGWAVLPVILSSSVHLQSLVLRKVIIS